MSAKYPCPGRYRVDEPDRKWHVPKGKLATQTTYCEECFIKYIKGAPDEGDYTLQTCLSNCNCDYDLESKMNLFSLEKHGIMASFLNPQTQPFFKNAKCTRISDTNLEIVLPTCTKYLIRIFSNDVFTMESAVVGSKQIIDGDGIHGTHRIVDSLNNTVHEPLVFISEESQPTVFKVKLQKWIVNNGSRVPVGDTIEFVFTLYCEQHNDEKIELNRKYYQSYAQHLQEKLADLTNYHRTAMKEAEEAKKRAERIGLEMGAFAAKLEEVEQYK